MQAVRLRTEYLVDPLGIDIGKPELFWNCEGGVKQTAYRILANDDSGRTVWDSDRVESDSMRAAWAGEGLRSRERVVWRVRLWDETGAAGEWSEPASFEMGLLHSSDWTAKWISGDYRPRQKHRYPADCFQTVFIAQDVKKARLYITACGLYEARLNGRRAGDFILAPGVTDYRRRIQYQTYDVTSLLNEGENVWTVQLADGWYRGSTGAWGLRNQYGKETKLLAQLEITDAAGDMKTIRSCGDWRWSNDGPIRFADNQDGEAVDARMQPSYSGWARETTCSVMPSASNNVPVTEHETFTAKFIETPAGKTVLDFGQNIAGYIAFAVNAKQGQQISLRFGEMLDGNDEFTQKNIQCTNKRKTTPLQQVRYTCKQGENSYKTTFAIFGFRYVLVETDVPFEPEDFTAIAVYSDMEETLSFNSSNPLLNRFVQNTLWSAKGNSADLPTDCPTRERHGWTGDAQIFFNTAGYLFNYAPFARKYLHDIYDWQTKSGCLPQIAPEGGTDFYMKSMNGSVGWADAGVLIPYRFYKLYGDVQILRDHYEGMARYAAFMQRRCGKRSLLAKRIRLKGEARRYLVNSGQAYGEWAEPADVHPMRWQEMAVPQPEVATAYTCCVMDVMAEVAAVLGKEEDAASYRTWAAGTRKAYQALRGLPEFTLDTDRQALLVRPLYFGLLDEEQTDYAKRRLIDALEHYGWRLGTGFLSTPLILDVLSDIDIEYAYRLLENEEMPGWLFMPKKGATTIWESWEGTEAQGGIASLNHYSKGAACEWLFKTMCGINIGSENGFIISPRPGGSSTHAKASYMSIYGEVSCSWKKDESNIVYEIIVPAGCSAKITLPKGLSKELQSGTYTFSEAI